MRLAAVALVLFATFSGCTDDRNFPIPASCPAEASRDWITVGSIIQDTEARPLEGVDVLLDGEHVTTTDARGAWKVHKMQEGCLYDARFTLDNCAKAWTIRASPSAGAITLDC